MKILIVFALLVASTALAADPDRAAELKAEADRLVLARDYAGALARLEEAYAADPEPGYIANQGVVLQKLGRHAEAAAAFDRFLATNPDPEKAQMARDMVARLRPMVEIMSDPPGAKVSTDQAELGTTPLKTPLVVGDYTLYFSLRKHDPLEVKVSVREGRKLSISQTLTPSKSAGKLVQVEIEKEAKPPAKRVWTWVALGTGVAAGVGAGVLYSLASGAVDDRDAARTGAAWDAAQSDAETWHLAMWGAAGLSAAALAAGGLLFFKESEWLGVQASPGGIGLVGRF